MRKTRAPSQNSHSNSTRKKRAAFTPQSARRDLFSHLAREIRELLTISSSAPEDLRELAQSFLNFQQEQLCTSSPTRVESFLQSTETEESSISKIRRTRPLQDHRGKKSSVYPSLGKKRPPFSLGKEILTITFTSSTDGREHTLKKKGWSSPQPSNKGVWPSPQPPKRKRTPPPHAPKPKESSLASCSR